jgi:hypothetical protein
MTCGIGPTPLPTSIFRICAIFLHTTRRTAPPPRGGWVVLPTAASPRPCPRGPDRAARVLKLLGDQTRADIKALRVNKPNSRH